MKSPTTAVLETRCDVRTLASLAIFVRDNTRIKLTNSAVIRYGIETLVDILIKENLTRQIISTEEAVEILSNLNMSTNRGGKNAWSLAKEIKAESNLSRESISKSVDEEKLQEAVDIFSVNEDGEDTKEGE